eukprot:g82474.t1
MLVQEAMAGGATPEVDVFEVKEGDSCPSPKCKGGEMFFKLIHDEEPPFKSTWWITCKSCGSQFGKLPNPKKFLN